MSIAIDENMKSRIKEFLDGWKETENDDMFGISDYDNWMETAVELLKEVIGENDEDDLENN